MQRALAILHRHLDGLADADESAELLRLVIADPVLADAWARLGRLEALLEEIQRDDRAAVRAVAMTKPMMKSVPPRRRRWYAAVAVAASLLLTLTAAMLWYNPRPVDVPPTDVISGRIRSDGRETTRLVEGETIEVVGDIPARIRLPDGSKAELAPASAVVLRGRGEGLRQTVELGRGGGIFQVGDGGRIRVSTPAGIVTARSAQFSVELQPLASDDEEEFMIGRKTLLLVVAALVGNVEVSNSGRNYVLAAGQTRAFAADGKEITGKPNAGGRVVAVSADGATLTIEAPPSKKGVEPKQFVIKITDRTRIEYRKVENDSGKKPTIGYSATVWLQDGSDDVAAMIRLEVVHVILSGRVTAVAEDGKSFTLDEPTNTGKPVVVRIAEGAKVVYAGIDKEAQKPTVGYHAQVWLKHGSKDVASGIQFKPTADAPKPDPKDPKDKPKPPEEKKPEKKPIKPDPEKKPVDPNPDKKPGKPEPVFPISARDPAPVVAAIDREWRRALDEAKVTATSEADDAEFLRRVTLDLTGRIPNWKRARAFLDSKEPDKRRNVIEQLLTSPAYGEHQGGIWRRLITPPDDGVKPQRDVLSPWLTEQFNRNRGWGDIVRDLVTAEGPVNRTPHLAFILANSESQRPQPELLADATSRLFLGVELRCAQCHDHPFNAWKQADFWALAAFYGRTHNNSLKGGPNAAIVETEEQPDSEKKGPVVKGAAVVVSAQTGRQAGKVIRARFPRGAELGEDVPGPYRARLVDWMTARDNPFFARNSVNRLWAQLFGRGLVMPLDGFDENNPPANSALLDVLAKEFVESDFDTKHLLRCVCLSQAYQRTSRTRPADATEDRLFSRMPVKPLSPDALFDSLQVVMIVDKNDPSSSLRDGQASAMPDREQFLRFFRAQHDGSDAGGLNQGIPQVLRLMNGPTFNAGAPVIESLLSRNVGREEAIETLFLVTCARRPTSSEVALFTKYLAKQPSARDGYTGMLWVLLNSSEFLLNH